MRITYTPQTVTATPLVGSCQATLTVTCAPIYACSGPVGADGYQHTIDYTDSSCVTTSPTSCSIPSYCVNGQSACVNPPPVFNAGFGTGGSGSSISLSGHFEANPKLVRKGTPARLFWNVSNINIATCSITDSGGGSMSAGCSGNTCTSGPTGVATPNVDSLVSYTLRCNALAGVVPSSFSETVSVLPAPVYEER